MTQEKQPPTPDFEALAQKYLDLWQDQIAKLARDPGQLNEAAAAWSQMASSFMKGAPGASTPFTASAHDRSAHASAPDGAAAPAAAHGPGGLDTAELLRRLDAIEHRLDALESKPRGTRTRTKPGSGRKRSSPPDRGSGGEPKT